MRVFNFTHMNTSHRFHIHKLKRNCQCTYMNASHRLYIYECEFTFTSWNEIAHLYINECESWSFYIYEYESPISHSQVEMKLPTFIFMSTSHQLYIYECEFTFTRWSEIAHLYIYECETPIFHSRGETKLRHWLEFIHLKLGKFVLPCECKIGVSHSYM